MANSSEKSTLALKGVPFFSNLNESNISTLAQKLIIRRFGPSQIIFHLGDPAGLLYIISSGKVKISHSTADGQEAVLAILGAGDFFGELALLEGVDFLLVDVDADDLVTDVGKTGTRYQADVTGAHDAYSHRSILRKRQIGKRSSWL